jgi:lysosomal Pro-X carboxypeptidase
MVFPLASNGRTDFYPAAAYNATWYSDYCNARYGVVRRPDWAATEFGGRDALRTASHIIFSNGLLDPWHGAAVCFPVGR